MKRLLLVIGSILLIGSASLYPMVRKQAQVIKQTDRSYLLMYESGKQITISPAQMTQILSELTSDRRALFLAGNSSILAEYIDQHIDRFSTQPVLSVQSSSTNDAGRAAGVVAYERQASRDFHERLINRSKQERKKESVSTETISQAELLEATKRKIGGYLKEGDIRSLERYKDYITSQSYPYRREQLAIIEATLVRDDVQMLVEMERGSTADAEELYNQVIIKSTDHYVLNGARAIVAKKKKPKPEIGALPWFGTNRLVDAPSAAVEHADMVSTPARAVPNISWDVDARIEAALQFDYIEAGQLDTLPGTLQVVQGVLDHLKKEGLLKPNQDAVQEAIRHGIIHFLKEFDPTNIADNPGEFMVNVTQHIAIATFHVMTDGMFLGSDRAISLATQIYDLYQAISTDHSDLTPNRRAELIAEQLAAIIKTFCVDQITRKALGSRARGGAAGASNSTSEVREVLASDGTRVQVRDDGANALLRDGTGAGGGSVKKVNNMKEFFEQFDFGKNLKKSSVKTNKRYDGQSIYKVVQKNNHDYLKKGDFFYIDALHKDHIEVFDSRGQFKTILNLDGQVNNEKVRAVWKQGTRNIKSVL